MGGSGIEIEAEVSGGGEIVVGVVNAETDGVGIAIVKQCGEGREVDLIRSEVHGLNAGDRDPEIGIDAAGEDPGIDGRDASRSAVNSDFAFTEGGVCAAFQFVGDIVGNAGVPEFIFVLALSEDVEEGALDIGGESESLLENGGAALSSGVEGDGAAGRSAGEGDDLIGGPGRILALSDGIKEEFGAAVEDAGIGFVDFVAEIDGAVLGDGKDGAVVGEVALDVPVAGSSSAVVPK